MIHVKKRNAGTKKINCPFKIRGYLVKGTSKWILRVESGSHNHPLADTFEGHSYVDKLKQDEHKIVSEIKKGGVKSKNTLTIIKEMDPSNTTGLKQIYNARQRVRMTESEGRSQMQQLLKRLNEKSYLEWTKRSDNDVLKEIFWSHPDSVKFTKCFPHVFIMDATYKTNMLKCPFLHVVGVTATYKSFTTCQVLMERETQVDYTWAMEKFRDMLGNIVPSVIVTDRDLALMNALDIVFPETKKFLCRWHIAMKVKSKGIKMLPGIVDKDDFDWRGKLNDMWRDVVNFDTEEEFNLNFSYLERDFIQFPDIAKYLSETWLIHKTRFIAARTDQHVHFGTNTTNMAEGSHSVLKHDLGKTCRHDFLGMWELIHPSLNIQISEVRASFERSKIKRQHRHNNPLFSELIGFVSHAALDQILKEIEFVGDIEVNASICGHHLRRTHGLPCACELVNLGREHRSISIHDIHKFWKKLLVNGNDGSNHGVDYKPAMELYIKRFASSSEDQQRNLVMKLLEIADPQRFNVVLVQISKPSCYTFLPLRTLVTPDVVKVLGLSLINENHYLKIDLQENCPIPEPVEFWKRFHYPMAMSWRTLLEPRINAFRSLNIQGITQRETFEGAPLFVG